MRQTIWSEGRQHSEMNTVGNTAPEQETVQNMKQKVVETKELMKNYKQKSEAAGCRRLLRRRFIFRSLILAWICPSIVSDSLLHFPASPPTSFITSPLLASLAALSEAGPRHAWLPG